MIYRVQFECGSSYVGETGRTLWEEAEILAKEQDWHKRKFKEALHIREESNTMKLDLGRLINPIWNTIT